MLRSLPDENAKLVLKFIYLFFFFASSVYSFSGFSQRIRFPFFSSLVLNDPCLIVFFLLSLPPLPFPLYFARCCIISCFLLSSFFHFCSSIFIYLSYFTSAVNFFFLFPFFKNSFVLLSCRFFFSLNFFFLFLFLF